MAGADVHHFLRQQHAPLGLLIADPAAALAAIVEAVALIAAVRRRPVVPVPAFMPSPLLMPSPSIERRFAGSW